jgi:ribosomal protein S18 acetylase RimI-like enzyme
MIIRPAAEEDLSHLAGLTRGALSFASSPDPYTWELSEEEMTKRLRAYLDPKKGIALVLQVENSIAGFVAAHFDELDPKRPDRSAVIDLLAVGIEYRGQGFGTHLVRELMLRLPEMAVTRMQVNVQGGSEPAMRFWRRAGFAEQSVTMALELEKPE